MADPDIVVSGFDAGAALKPDTAYLILTRLLAPVVGADAISCARRLLDDFGSLAGVIGAEAGALLQLGFAPELANHLDVVRTAMIAATREEVCNRSSLNSAADLVAYVRPLMAHLPTEQVRVLYVDARNRLIRDEVVGWGTASSAPCDPAVIMRKALILGASAIFLAHNHPAGSHTPSGQDLTTTRRVAEAGRHLGICVLDHLIVTAEGVTSLRAAGYL